jgi:hypothetical protein
VNTEDWFRAIRRMELGREPTAADDAAYDAKLERDLRRLQAEDARRRPDIARRRAAMWAEGLTLPELKFHFIEAWERLPEADKRAFLDHLAGREAA